MADIYQADAQLDQLKAFLDISEIRDELGIPENIITAQGVDTGDPNIWGVMIQNPYYIMPDVYLPQLVIDLQGEAITDENFNNAETTTAYHIYYVKELVENDPEAVKDMYSKLKYVARYLIENHRTCEDSWYSMTLPRIEPNNEVNRYFAEAQPRILLMAGRISFELKDKRAYR